VHTCAPSAGETDWRRIVALYDALLRVRPSPVVELNRAIAIAQVEGPQRGLEELRTIADPERLAAYPFYPAALGELELRCGRQRPRASTSCRVRRRHNCGFERGLRRRRTRDAEDDARNP
jgi:predicted RNA polymerase sigma factor